MARRFYQPVMDAVPRDAEAVVVYNQASAATRTWRRSFSGITVLHLGNDIFGRWRPRHVAEAIQRHDLVVAVSDFTASHINRRTGQNSVRVLRNGVDTETFSPASEPSAGPPVILFVGNMVPHKGAHHLLRAAQILADQNLDFVVRIVGSWGLSSWETLTPYERELRNLAHPLGKRVQFVPFVGRDQIADEYRQARVFAMPVDWDEPAGQVVTEAMASGIPVVSARRGGIPEYLGRDGAYADPTNSLEFAAALRTFVVNEQVAREVGAALRRQAKGMTWAARMWEFNEMLSALRGVTKAHRRHA